MYFKRIEMHGFKSFAEPVVVDFDRGITCVVGPNGSGKSNISDAIRWVLGEQSPKMLRGGKMEDVIFSGTATRKSRGMAEVTLVIDNSDGKLPIQFNEVAITRRMYRSGESEYAINNNQCRMRDIRDLIADTGIGVDGYSLIGQGKISEIISNKKESIREIFEETAGIVSYRNKKSEAERKLENTKLNMERLEDIILEIEGRIDGLREDSQKAKTYLELKDRYQELEVGLCVLNLAEIEERAKVLKDDLQGLEKSLKEEDEKRKLIEENNLDFKEKLEYFEKESILVKEELDKITEELNRNTNENNLSRERIISIRNNENRLKREIKENIIRLEEERVNKSQKEEFRAKKLQEFEEIENQIKNFAVETENVKQKLEEDKNSIRDKENRFFEISQDIALLNIKKDNLDNILKNLEVEDFSLQENRSEIESLKLHLKDAQEILKNLEYEKQEIDKTLGGLEKETQENKEKYRVLKIEHNDILLKNGKYEERRRTLKEMEENYEGYHYPVKFIMSKNLKGVLGFVAEVLKVDKDKSVAIETALGGSIQNVICENEEVAKECITLLKNNRAGRLTFLPIHRIKPKIRKEDKIDFNGILGFADSLVGYDDRFANIVSYLLGHTVIAKDLDSGIAFSKKDNRYKIVTLQGEVISSTGAMSGGSLKNKNTNLFERKNEIEELENIIKTHIVKKKQIEENLIETEKNIESCEERLQETRETREKIENKLQEAREENRKVNQNIETLIKEEEKKLSIQQNKDKDILEVKAKIKGKIQEIEKLQEEKDELEKDIEKNRDFSENYEKTFEENKSKLIELQIEANSKRKEEDAIKGVIELLDKNISHIENEISAKENQIESLKIDETSLNEIIDIRSDRILSLKAEKDTNENKLVTLNEEMKKYKLKREEEYTKKQENQEKINKLQQQKYDIDIKLAKQDSQQENLIEKLWSEFEISYAEAKAVKPLDIPTSLAVKENREIKNKIKNLGDINIGSIKEYEEIEKRYEFLKVQREDITVSMDELNFIISDMDKIIKSRFKDSFNSISENFESIFKEFFGGGQGRIEIDNIDDPLNSSIDIIAQPPGKQLKNINLLSGGEKTMTAIALMFAVLKTKPTPCCILDEVEAALDDHNIHIFANYLRKFDNIQFTLITHQKTTMEHADAMYGITMAERGISKIFSLDMKEYRNH